MLSPMLRLGGLGVLVVSLTAHGRQTPNMGCGAMVPWDGNVRKQKFAAS